MTETAQPVDPAPVRVATEPGTKLEQLHAAYAVAKAEADSAAERLKGIVDSIKLELTQAEPDAPKIVLNTEGQRPLQLAYVETWRFDSANFKKADPETYVRYAKKSGSWILKQIGAAGGDQS